MMRYTKHVILFNTLTRQKEELKPLKKGEVKLYTCGPTVYDHAHIGNLRTYIFEDILRRTLKLSGYKVAHVMNLTDVDDKTIARSQQKYPNEQPREALKKLTSEYERIFFEDTDAIGIDFGDTKIVRATEHIKDMQDLIKRIDNKYLTEDGVYFEIAKYPNYGVFEKIDQSHTHHRIRNDEYDKEHVADFALWKTKKGDEPAWDFELEGKNIEGRPGWHIECSAMSIKYLGQPFDIHTGGVDLKFPHHENEVAQAKAAGGKNLANTFLHSEHLLVDGRKMSKSLQNFYTLQDIKDKGFDPLAFRLLILQAHYRSELNFTWESLTAAQTFLQKLQNFAGLRFQAIKTAPAFDFKATTDKIKKHLSDDLNTSQAIAKFGSLTDEVPAVSSQTDFEGFLEFLDQAFGLNLMGEQDIPDSDKELITEREAARQAQDYAKSDELRTELETRGISLNDTPYGPIWYRS